MVSFGPKPWICAMLVVIFLANSTRGKWPLNSPPFWGEDFFERFPIRIKEWQIQGLWGFSFKFASFCCQGAATWGYVLPEFFVDFYCFSRGVCVSIPRWRFFFREGGKGAPWTLSKWGSLTTLYNLEDGLPVTLVSVVIGWASPHWFVSAIFCSAI